MGKLIRSAMKSWRDPALPYFAVQPSGLRTGSKVRMILNYLLPDRPSRHMLRNTNEVARAD